MTFLVESDSSPGVHYTVSFVRGAGPAGVSCTCPAFRKSRGWHGLKECKHVLRVMRHGCMWNALWYGGGDKTLQPVAGSCSETVIEEIRCPHCGGPTV